MLSAVSELTEYSGDKLLRLKFGTPDIPVQTTISESITRYLESFEFFFIATSNRKGECDASFRGKREGAPIIKIIDSHTIIFPDYLGNGSFRSLGNILENPHIGMVFMDLNTGTRIELMVKLKLFNLKNGPSCFPKASRSSRLKSEKSTTKIGQLRLTRRMRYEIQIFQHN